MKLSRILPLLTIFSALPVFADTQTLLLPSSKVTLGEGPAWIQSWSLNELSGIDLSTVTDSPSAFLGMSFSGTDFAYLMNEKAKSLTALPGGGYEWAYTDSKVDYRRIYRVEGETLTVEVKVKFLGKAPDWAFVNLASRGLKNELDRSRQEILHYGDGKISREKLDEKIKPFEVLSPVKWFGAGSHYFVLAVFPEGLTSQRLEVKPADAWTAQSSLHLPVKNGEFSGKFKVAFAPKRLDVLRAIDPSLDTTLNLGFFTLIAYPILWLLKFIYKFTGNYGFAIIILTVIVKLLTFPLVVKSMKGMRKMAEFQPKMKALQDKYKDDKARLNQEMMLLMKTSGYNPMAGCFPMLLQMPIFFALYSVLDSAEELYRAPFALWIVDLSAKDPLWITPVLMSVVMFLQQKLTPPSPGMDPAQQKMMAFMPLIFGAFMLTTPAGLCVYMLVNAIISVIQQQYLNKKLGVPAHAANMASSF
jgi:YidC/Oxa1 family membrane protein insertase